MVRDGDWCPAWCHAWCNDRACPACAQQRSRQLAVALRRCVEQREGRPLYFVTLTMPRDPTKDARAAWRSLNDAWSDLRRCPEFAEVAGGVRIVEVVHRPGAGWHPHFHCIVELTGPSRPVPCPTCDGRRVVARRVGQAWRTNACRTCSSSTQPGDGTMPADLAALLRAWVACAPGASTAAQCGVRLDDANAGQLAKYLTKLWEMSDGAARELFDVAAGRRLAQTWGNWYGKRGLRIHADTRHGPQWWTGPLLEDIERMHPRSYVYFGGSVPGVQLEPFSCADVGALESTKLGAHEPKGPPIPHRTERPWLAVYRVTAGALLRRIAADQRRVDEHPPIDGPRPGRDLLLAAGGAHGLWSARYRNMQRARGRAPPRGRPDDATQDGDG